jgi:hypothetical protein
MKLPHIIYKCETWNTLFIIKIMNLNKRRMKFKDLIASNLEQFERSYVPIGKLNSKKTKET